MRILVTGATGYVGSRLVPRLLAAGHRVVCLARDPERLSDWSRHDGIEIVAGDLLQRETLAPALAGCDAAFYLVHSMGRQRDFRSAEEMCAENFRDAAAEAGIGGIVYLGGLAPESSLSRHLASRRAVGRILAAGDVPVTELRAAVVVGAGSLSFEMLRYLTEVLPVMTTPRWVRSRCQPIAVDDLLEILTRAVATASDGGRVIDIGGPDVLTYEQMMRLYAREAGLRKRLIIPLPFLSPGLSSLWVGLVTPLPAAAARPLIGSLRHDATVEGGGVGGFPEVARTPFREALLRALGSPPEPREAGPPESASVVPNDPDWAGGTEYTDRRLAVSAAAPEDLARAFTRIGGANGYYAADWAWTVRGLLDLVLGGPGRRRGRPHPETLEEGDDLDFWRVQRLEPGKRLLLEAEMKVPGTAWLEFVAEPYEGGSRLVQTAYFRPRGLGGRLYWAVLLPIHTIIFGRMARKIAAAASPP